MEWMDTELNEWDDEMIEQFIFVEKNYSYDGDNPIKHSAISLISPCDMDNKEKVKRFNEIYKRIN
jgi:hypothetical protein